jgi:hypothetical protein
VLTDAIIDLLTERIDVAIRAGSLKSSSLLAALIAFIGLMTGVTHQKPSRARAVNGPERSHN